MARDAGLEELVRAELPARLELTENVMFGGWVWKLHGHLLVGARRDGLLARLGKGNDAWALAQPDVQRMISAGRALEGWVRAGPAAYGDDDFRRELIAAAVKFVSGLPPKG